MDVYSILTNQEQMSAKLAVVLYEGGGHTRATVNPIERNPLTGRTEIRPGDCLTAENLEHISTALSGGARARRVLPENVLLVEHGIIAWWTPSKRRPIFFDTKTDFDKIANATVVLHPALMFVGRPRALTVYALTENKRPDDSTRLWRAPYYNLYGLGAMCEGNVPMPDSALPSAIPEFEKAFFESSFVHSNLGSKDLTAHPKGHNQLWLDLAGEKPGHRYGRKDAEEFPVKWLVPLEQGGLPMTVAMALNMPGGNR